ncbi:hypothetical protein ACVWWG_000016 [Bradyrhizobium sp. LB7.2]
MRNLRSNLIRHDPTPAQWAMLIAKRKAAYDAVHAPAKAVDTAAKTGKPERMIQRDATHRWDRSCVTSRSDDGQPAFVVALPERDSSAPLRSGIALIVCPSAHRTSQAAVVLEGRANTP